MEASSPHGIAIAVPCVDYYLCSSSCSRVSWSLIASSLFSIFSHISLCSLAFPASMRSMRDVSATTASVFRWMMVLIRQHAPISVRTNAAAETMFAIDAAILSPLSSAFHSSARVRCHRYRQLSGLPQCQADTGC